MENCWRWKGRYKGKSEHLIVQFNENLLKLASIMPALTAVIIPSWALSYIPFIYFL